MANIRINSLPPDAAPNASDVTAIDGATTRKATLAALVAAGRPLASQAEAEAGAEATKAMTPLTTAQAIASQGGVAFATAAQGATADAALPAIEVVGGATGQVLAKASAADNDFVWSNAGAGDVLAVNNLSDLDNIATARTNLELTAAATADLIDDPTFGTATAANIPSAESVKTYADTKQAAATNLTTLSAITPGTPDANSVTALSLMGYKRAEANASGGGTTTTTTRSVIEILDERVSIYDYIPREFQADIRTGLHSSSLTPYFDRAVANLNPGGTNIPGGVNCFIPKGKYLIDDDGVAAGVQLQDSIEWTGENKEGTRLQAMGNNPIFTSVGTSANQVGRAAVRNMTLVGDGKTHNYGYGIELLWMNNPRIEDVQFQALRWCITQQYTVNAFIQRCTSNGSSGTIHGYLWKKAIDSLLHAGTDNTTTISDVYFMAGDGVALLLHGSNGIQMGANVALLQCGVRVGAIAETESDGSSFTPGADNDVIHFQHWDGLRLDTIVNDRAIRIVKGAMAAPHDIFIRNLWAGNITGTNSYVFDFDGVEDFGIGLCNIDTTGQGPIWFQNCSRGVVSGNVLRNIGGNNAQNAALLQTCTGIGFADNAFRFHSSATTGNGIRAESSSRIRSKGNDFDWNGVAVAASQARRAVLVDTTGSVISGNTSSDLASSPCVEAGTANNNRIHDNPSTAAPTLVGANSFGHHNNTTTT